MTKTEAVTIDKKRERQIEIFKERCQPEITLLSEGVNVVRGLMKRNVNSPYRWDDMIRFSHPRIKDVKLWDVFCEKYFEHFSFNENPSENLLGFLQEVFDLVTMMHRSVVLSEEFTFSFERPESIRVIQVAKGKEKFDFEKYPATYVFAVKLQWVIKP